MDFLSFASACGLIISHVDYGRWVRVKTENHAHKKNGAYFHGGDYALVQDWATMVKPDVWRSDKAGPDIEIRIKKDAEKYLRDRQRLAQNAAATAKDLIGNAELAPHPYLERKGFKELKALVTDSLLIVPMFHNGNICGLQKIAEDGDKKFIFGQRCSNAYFRIGSGKKEFLVEGYASGLSLQAVLSSMKVQYSIFVCFSAGNAAKMAISHPGAFWIADNDKSGAGQDAAEASGLKWWMPEPEGFDINDLHIARGLFACRELLRKSIS